MLGSLTILVYHGVTDVKSFGIENYTHKHLPVEEFRAQMKFVAEKCSVLSMDEVVEHYTQSSPFPPNAVAITFDDGFRNNYSTAAPVLSEFNLPATFYITAGMINSKKMFWVDEIEDCINLTKKQFIEIELNEACSFNLSTETEKQKAVEIIKAYCKSALVSRKDNVISQLREITEIVPSVEHAENYLKITAKQLKEMNLDPLFTIGGHSLEHNILSKFDTVADAEADMRASVRILAELLGEPIRHYAYPEGQPEHFNTHIINFLKQQNIIACPSAIDGINNGNEDLFTLKRVMPGFKGRSFPFEHFNVTGKIFA